MSQTNLSSKGPAKVSGPLLSSKQGEITTDCVGSCPLKFQKSSRKEEINNLPG